MLPVSSRIGTKFGVKGKHWAAGYHTGVDFLCPRGTIVKTVAPGKIVHAGRGGWGAAYGIHVIQEITAGSLKGRRVIYAHLSSEAVRVGQAVTGGQAIGRSGATGNVTGPHLHLEVRVRGKSGVYGYWNHVNPASVLAWKPAVTPPPFKYPSRRKPGKKWVKVRSQNCSFNNNHGIKTGDARLPGLVKMMVENQTDLLACQELPAKYRDRVDRAIRKYYMVRMAGDYGRYIYGDKRTVRKIKGKSVTPPITAGGAEKPYTLLHARVRGGEVLFVDIHLKDGVAWANHRRKYIRKVMPSIIKYAKEECKLPKHRILLSGDWNGYKEIIEEMSKFGFYASYGMAHNKKDTKYKTTNQKKTSKGWAITTEEGRPIDMNFSTANRPCSIHNNRRHGYADHGSNRATYTFAAK